MKISSIVIVLTVLIIYLISNSVAVNKCNEARKVDIERLSIEIDNIKNVVNEKSIVNTVDSMANGWKFEYADTVISYRKDYKVKFVTLHYFK